MHTDRRSSRLDPASRRILRARPLRIDFAETGATWTCTYCHLSFPVEEGWGLQIESEDGAYEFRFVVCSDCARVFDPPPAMRIDLTRMRTQEPSAVVFEDLADQVVRIAEARGEPDRDAVTVRSSDIRGYAAEHEVSPLALARFLIQEGLAWPV